MYKEFLKELYYKERKKLEEMWVFKQESKMKLVRFKKSALEEMQSHLTISEIEGRNDIDEEVKDRLLRDKANEDKVRKRLDENMDDELTAIEKETGDELRNANYSAFDFADYLFQLEKVAAIEAELENNRLFPEEVYLEQKTLAEKKD